MIHISLRLFHLTEQSGCRLLNESDYDRWLAVFEQFTTDFVEILEEQFVFYFLPLGYWSQWSCTDCPKIRRDLNRSRQPRYWSTRQVYYSTWSSLLSNSVPDWDRRWGTGNPYSWIGSAFKWTWKWGGLLITETRREHKILSPAFLKCILKTSPNPEHMRIKFSLLHHVATKWEG